MIRIDSNAKKLTSLHQNDPDWQQCQTIDQFAICIRMIRIDSNAKKLTSVHQNDPDLQLTDKEAE